MSQNIPQQLENRENVTKILSRTKWKYALGIIHRIEDLVFFHTMRHRACDVYKKIVHKLIFEAPLVKIGQMSQKFCPGTKTKTMKKGLKCQNTD